ncbi:ATP-binding cassette domain-containing protein [Pseudobacter ginsenosidimutans]|uniref:ATP-binding cassette subfamily C protein n=1 Tax=Pseudobacter ginsenosidimutans TaxID=661488 RepID=A0A4Q7N1I1_9BACT|nr:ATP-binding cassette domain-containing protein [Pseudobacter ginsenosidimutans]QEC43079.1 ATP-binding cassette domain-containing protein [Pseudobacter ginsenosidimutans]RZS74434.1 ATP-binding cassette subfamily C protein [Pseudobacter ginsenosidimutans]
MAGPSFVAQIESDLLSVLRHDNGNGHALGHGLLLQCMNLAGAGQGLYFQPIAGNGSQTITRQLQAIARQSNVLARKVRLQGNWWTSDLGSMVGFTKDGAVCAILQEKGNYFLVDPKAGQRQKIDAALAANLSEAAFVFCALLGEEPISNRSLLQFALSGRRKELLAFAGSSVVISGLNLVLPLAFSSLIGNVIPSANSGMLVQLCILLLLIGLLIFCFSVYRNLVLLRFETKADLKLQVAFFNKILNLPAGFFAKTSAGELVERSLGFSKIRVMISSGVVLAFFSSLQLLFNLGLMFVYSTRLGLLALAALLIYLVLLFISYRRENLANSRQLQAKTALNSRIYQFISGIAKIKTAGKELFVLRQWSGHYAKERTLAQDTLQAEQQIQLLNYLFPSLALLMIYGFSGQVINSIRPGDFAGFITAFGLLAANVIALGSSVSGILKAVALFKKLEPILNTAGEKEPGPQEQLTLDGRIEFNQVSYSYGEDTPPIIDGMSFAINEGETVAFVGASGSGKSTIFRLLLGFETPKAGSIYFDEQDLKQLNIKAVRRNMGVVLQNSTLTGGSIYENISGGHSGYTAVWEALAKVGMKKEIEALPMGLHTVVSDAGGSFSGGQQQRLLIARALSGNPRIILFDEATSALDNISQAIITHTLHETKATKLIIAHRLETIMAADRVYFIGNGKIIQAGSPAELMTTEGPFQNFARRQLK